MESDLIYRHSTIFYVSWSFYLLTLIDTLTVWNCSVKWDAVILVGSRWARALLGILLLKPNNLKTPFYWILMSSILTNCLTSGADNCKVQDREMIIVAVRGRDIKSSTSFRFLISGIMFCVWNMIVFFANKQLFML